MYIYIHITYTNCIIDVKLYLNLLCKEAMEKYRPRLGAKAEVRAVVFHLLVHSHLVCSPL